MKNTSKPREHLSYTFIAIFALYVFLGSFTQLIQIISLPLHIKLGLSEPSILEPEFGWLRAYELASAWSDQTHLLAGAAFIIGGPLRRKSWSIPFGFYTCATCSFVMLVMCIRWSLLEMNGFGVLGGYSTAFAYGYAYAAILFGWYGMYYLWSHRQVYDDGPIKASKAIGQRGDNTRSMEPKKHLSHVFLGAFTFLLMMGPFTQLIQIISLPLHVKLGLSEPIILQPEYGWLKAEELAIAWADQTYLVAGTLFVAGAFLRKPWCIPLGFYSTAAWSIIMLMERIRWSLLEMNGFGILDDYSTAFAHGYAYVYILFGWYAMYYLWRNRRIHDKLE